MPAFGALNPTTADMEPAGTTVILETAGLVGGSSFPQDSNPRNIPLYSTSYEIPEKGTRRDMVTHGGTPMNVLRFTTGAVLNVPYLVTLNVGPQIAGGASDSSFKAMLHRYNAAGVLQEEVLVAEHHGNGGSFVPWVLAAGLVIPTALNDYLLCQCIRFNPTTPWRIENSTNGLPSIAITRVGGVF